ncbi:hypothetical protein Dsin_006137 [Dipteronia sinensis]|uniref:Transmembrane protein n=1 Tax=Dipteronia sinensis TaxID=43782 RepID=A0AAE0AZ01_9ROSI|nr:hypothetical protein Dsin_006137 [Dipteronia sinensis]
MAQVFLVCLILADAFLGLAMANQTTQKQPTFSNPLAHSPSIRKIGKHQQKVFKSFHETVTLSPSDAPQQATTETTVSNQSSNEDDHQSVRFQSLHEEIHLKKNHHSADKSVAGGGVILGGLATTFFVALFCYIRATGRHTTDNQTQTTV